MDKSLLYKSVIGELHFLPSVHYMTCLTTNGIAILEHHENYNKGSFRNKCFVSSNQNNQYVVVPLKKGKHSSQPIQKVKISYDEDWIKILEHRIQTEYGNYPYFDYYIQDIRSIVLRKRSLLYELNKNLMEYFFWLLDFKSFTYSQKYKHDYHMEVLDLRDKITPSYFKNNPGLLSSLSMGHFHFTPGHSIIEALFAYGPEIKLLINEYAKSLH